MKFVLFTSAIAAFAGSLSAQSLLSSSGQFDASHLGELKSGLTTNVSPNGGRESNTNIFIYQEQTLTLSSNYVTETGQTLLAGNRYTSFLVVSDPVGNKSGRIKFTGSVTFDRNVGGADYSATPLSTGDSVWGIAGVNYGNGQREAEYPTEDTATFNGKTASFVLSTEKKADQFRVYVGDSTPMSVPEPSAMALLGLGLVAGIFHRKRSH